MGKRDVIQLSLAKTNEIIRFHLSQDDTNERNHLITNKQWKIQYKHGAKKI
jgi:hypothetical protein